MKNAKINKFIELLGIAFIFIMLSLSAAQCIDGKKIVDDSGNIQTGAFMSESSGNAQASHANSVSPVPEQIQYLSQPPVMTAAQKKIRDENIDRTHLPGPSISQSALTAHAEIPAGPQGGATEAQNLVSLPGDFVIFKNSPIGGGAPASEISSVNEPSAGSNGNYVFYTGNWYAARSTDGGSTFSYINPYADMPTFCCDQEVIYDPSRDIFIWYRQGVSDANGVNFFKLGISNDNGATWFFYDYYPSNVNDTWTNQWWDYPYITLSDNYLYISSNMFNSASSWTRSVIVRFPLDQLRDHAGLSFDYVDWNDNFNFALVQGAKTTMYWGTHNTNSNFRLFSWNETSGKFSYYDRSIPVWTDTYRNTAHCPSPDGYNWCARTDDRVTGGWIANGTIGFFWNVKEGPGFNYPYINAATFNESTRNYISRPYIYSPNYAWQYGYAAPDIRGNLGIAAFWGGGGYYPNHAVGIDDDLNGVPPAWELVTTNYGTNGPSSNKWGDYIRVRPYVPSRRNWIATGFTQQGGSDKSNADPHYIEFGRERDRIVSLGEAVDNLTLPWSSGGNAYWYGQTVDSYYGGDAARSDTISDNQNTWIQTTVLHPNN